jgi:hypothetical protein
LPTANICCGTIRFPHEIINGSDDVAPADIRRPCDGTFVASAERLADHPYLPFIAVLFGVADLRRFPHRPPWQRGLGEGQTRFTNQCRHRA